MTLDEWNVEILRRIKTAKTRDEAAWTYALALTVFGPGYDSFSSPDPQPWPAINAAILSRWTRSGLMYIKKSAWKLNEIQERLP